MNSASHPPEAWLETADGRVLELRGNYRLGRSEDNHVIIDGQRASRHHAAIHAQDDQEFWLIDLGSRNGTFCNGQRVLRPTRLRHGDGVKLAGASFVFRQPNQGAPSSSDGRSGKATITEFKDQHAWLLIADMESFTQLSQEWPTDKLAVSVGRWIQDGQRLVGKSGGRISKFLGDGFLACWESAPEAPRAVVETLHGFHALRTAGAVKFRVVVHHGSVTFGGAVQFGEENMIGSELNYVFRLEKLASDLGLPFCLSSAAGEKLDSHLPLEAVPGEHELKNFPGRHRCFTVRFPDAAAA